MGFEKEGIMGHEEVNQLILQTGEIQSLPFWKDKSWKHYPFAYKGTEEHYTLPAAEGWRPGNESQSWTIEGHVKAKESGKRYAFINVYNYNVMGRLLGFHWRLFQVTDIAENKRHTDRRYHFRPFPDLFKPHFTIKEGNLDLTYHPRDGGTDRLYTKQDSSGNLIPFEYRLEASCIEKSGERVNLSVDLEALKPPMVLGAMDYYGKVTMMGQPDTFSLSFPRFKISGTLDLSSRVEHIGGIGWAGLQWAPKHFGKKNHPLRRIKHQIYFVHLSNGWDFNFWRQYDTFRCNRVIPFSGISAVLEDNRMATTNNYSLEPISYYRNPGSAKPLLRTAPKTHYYTHAARLTIPEWGADLTISPILEDNTTGLFVEYLIASTEITGKIRGKEVYGVGLTEHTKIWYENYELVRMIQNTLKNLPDKAFVEDREHTQRKLINDLEEVLVFAELGDESRARNLLGADLEIISKKLREDEIKGPTARPSTICRDLMNLL
jgi:hypothetical protein